MKIDRAGIVGVGLMGGSISLVLKKLGIKTAGFGREKSTLEKALSLNIVDEISEDLKDTSSCDLIVICTPVMAIIPTMKILSGIVKKDSIITDVGSVKLPIVASGDEFFEDRGFFVGGHPIAGTEKSGPEFSDENLFRNRRMIFTPTAKTDYGALNTLNEIWESAGALISTMTAESHDEIFGYVSHLPHMVTYSLVNAVSKSLVNGENSILYSGGGFKDITRIASSSPEMWKDICFMNKEYILKAIESFEKELGEIKNLISMGDEGKLLKLFETAKNSRDKIE